MKIRGGWDDRDVSVRDRRVARVGAHSVCIEARWHRARWGVEVSQADRSRIRGALTAVETRRLRILSRTGIATPQIAWVLDRPVDEIERLLQRLRRSAIA